MTLNRLYRGLPNPGMGSVAYFYAGNARCFSHGLVHCIIHFHKYCPLSPPPLSSSRYTGGVQSINPRELCTRPQQSEKSRIIRGWTFNTRAPRALSHFSSICRTREMCTSSETIGFPRVCITVCFLKRDEKYSYTALKSYTIE